MNKVTPFIILKKQLSIVFLLSAFFAGEPGLLAQAPVPMDFGQSITGNLPLTSSTASFTTPVVQPGDVLLVRAAPTGLIQLKIEVYSPSDQFMAAYYANDYIVHFFFTVPAAPIGGTGSYKLVVSGTDGFFTGGFCLFLQQANSPSGALPLNCNSSLSDNLDCISSVMTLQVMLQEGAVSRITINANTLSTPEVWLCSSDGEILQYGVGASNYSLTFDSFVATYTGCYYIYATDQGAFFTNGGFNVSHTLLSGNCAAPSVQIVPADGEPCVGSPFYLSADSPLSGASYSWSGPTGFTSTDAEILFAEAMESMSGDYTVTVTAPGVCPVVMTRTVDVQPLPTATATVMPADGSVCAGDDFQLDVMTNASGSRTFRWEGPGYTSSQKSPIRYNVQPAQSGYYHISVTDGNGCVGTDSIEVTVHALPFVAISQPLNEGVCRGNTLQLFAQTTAEATTFSWTGPNAFSSTLQGPQIQNAAPAHAGAYHVTVTDVNECSNSTSEYIAVWNLPQANISPSSDSICLGESIQLTASGGELYRWSTGEMTKEISVAPLQTTAYSVTVTDNHGCTDAGGATVTVNPLPSISVFFQPADLEICSGIGQILLGVMSDDANNPIWEWKKNGVYYSNDQFIPLSEPGQSGVYTASVTDGITGCSSTAPPDTAIIHQTPSVNITHITEPPYYPGDELILCANSDATGPSYDWVGPDGFAGTSACATVDELSTLKAGAYSVTVTDIHGCQGFADAEVEIIVGTVEPAKAWGLVVGPNPSSGMVRIRTEKTFSGKLEITLFDSNGRRLRSFWMETPSLTLDLTDIAAGLYALRISDGEKVGAVRLAVVR